MFTTLIDSLRSFIGSPEFYFPDGSVDYSAMIEYLVAAIIIIAVICNIFALLRLILGGNKR